MVYSSEMNVPKKRLYVFASDSKGGIHVITLTEIIKHLEIDEIEKQKKGQTY